MTNYKKQYQRGEATTVIIIVLALTLLTALGWIFYQNFIQEDSTKRETDLIVVDKSKDGGKKGETLAVSESVLTLSRYGVEIPLGDITTKYVATPRDVEDYVVYDITAQIGSCNHGNMGMIGRLGAVNEKVTGFGDTFNGKHWRDRLAREGRTWQWAAENGEMRDSLVVAGGYVYQYSHPQSVDCQGQEKQEVAAKEVLQNTLFKKLRVKR